VSGRLKLEGGHGPLFKCWFPWTHRYSWPMLDRRSGTVLEHCTWCGRVREHSGPLAGASSEKAIENFPKSSNDSVVESI
jgi:hypothetical protein